MAFVEILRRRRRDGDDRDRDGDRDRDDCGDDSRDRGDRNRDNWENRSGRTIQIMKIESYIFILKDPTEIHLRDVDLLRSIIPKILH